AAALAAWKRAVGPTASLGKAWEAAIAAFNPEMAAELRLLDQTELAVWFDRADGAPHWWALVPHDDGTFAHLATALTLTDGRQEPAIDALAVDRLGPAGWPLAVRLGGRLALADAREGLTLALGAGLAHAWEANPELPARDSGWFVGLDPAG